MYHPKKDTYNSLTQLVKEMTDAGVSTAFTGDCILTKTHKYTLFDGQITAKPRVITKGSKKPA